MNERRRGLKGKGGRGQEGAVFDRRLQSSMEEIMNAQDFNFAPEFPQHGGFLAQNFVFSGKKILQKENFPTG